MSGDREIASVYEYEPHDNGYSGYIIREVNYYNKDGKPGKRWHYDGCFTYTPLHVCVHCGLRSTPKRVPPHLSVYTKWRTCKLGFISLDELVELGNYRPLCWSCYNKLSVQYRQLDKIAEVETMIRKMKREIRDVKQNQNNRATACVPLRHDDSD